MSVSVYNIHNIYPPSFISAASRPSFAVSTKLCLIVKHLRACSVSNLRGEVHSSSFVSIHAGYCWGQALKPPGSASPRLGNPSEPELWGHVESDVIPEENLWVFRTYEHKNFFPFPLPMHCLLNDSRLNSIPLLFFLKEPKPLALQGYNNE